MARRSKAGSVRTDLPIMWRQTRPVLQAESVHIDVPEGAVNVKRALARSLLFSCLLTRAFGSGGAFEQHLAAAGGREGAVKVGPLGPPVGEALAAPCLGYRQP